MYYRIVSRDGQKRLHTCSMLGALTVLEAPVCSALLKAVVWVASLVRVEEFFFVSERVVPSRPGSFLAAALPLLPACRHNAA